MDFIAQAETFLTQHHDFVMSLVWIAVIVGIVWPGSNSDTNEMKKRIKNKGES